MRGVVEVVEKRFGVVGEGDGEKQGDEQDENDEGAETKHGGFGVEGSGAGVGEGHWGGVKEGVCCGSAMGGGCRLYTLEMGVANRGGRGR